jgi:hypothetical protein
MSKRRRRPASDAGPHRYPNLKPLPPDKIAEWVARFQEMPSAAEMASQLWGDEDRTEGVRDQGGAGQGEGDSGPLTDRQCLILETMLEHEVTSERRRQTRAAIVRLVNRTHKPQNYNRDFAALVKRGLLRAREGPGGGIWLTPAGQTEATRLLQE